MAGTPHPKAEHSQGPGIALTPSCQHYLENRFHRRRAQDPSRETTNGHSVRLPGRQCGSQQLGLRWYAS